jgi:uncharacterized protein YdaU (DUF1376 family)
MVVPHTIVAWLGKCYYLAMKPMAFPIEEVFTCRVIASADVAVLGAALRILRVYWQSGCRPLPETDAALRYHAGCTRQRWHYIKNDVKRVINAVIGILPPLYHKRRKIAESNQAKAQKAGQISVAKRRRKAQLQVGEKAFLSDERSTHVQGVAVPPQPTGFNRGTHDPIRRAQAIKNNATAKEMLFTDD